jgi:hypothetical protein
VHGGSEFRALPHLFLRDVNPLILQRHVVRTEGFGDPVHQIGDEHVGAFDCLAGFVDELDLDVHPERGEGPLLIAPERLLPALGPGPR